MMVRQRRDGKRETTPFLDLDQERPRLGFLSDYLHDGTVGQVWQAGGQA